MIKKIITKTAYFALNFIKYLRKGGVVYVNVAQLSKGEVLKGKRVIVTGGTSGIGYAIAKKFLSEGATVVITGRSVERLNEAAATLKGNLYPLVWDVANCSIAKEKIEEAVSLLGGIDILVNNAGIYTSVPFASIDQLVWDEVMNINLKGVFFLCQAAMNHLSVNEHGGKIINITSISAFKGDCAPYGISKWGVTGLTKGLARKFFHKNIIVNAIAPGVTAATGMNNINAKENAYHQRGPRNSRFALPEEIAEIASFLASDAANNIVGQTIVCDGGATLI